jgi:thiamine biosynthesis lipoprotein
LSLRSALACALAGLSVGCAGVEPESPVTASDGRYVMGTVLEITLVGRDEARLRETLDELFALAGRLDRLLTVYDTGSDVSRLNRSAGRGPQSVDPEVAAVLRRAADLARLTRGSFDVTVGPLVALWTGAADRDAPPSPAELARALARVGADRVRPHDDGTVELTEPGVRVDLGGIAKGYALDRMLPRLRERGIRRALLNFGQSSAWALGTPVEGPAWRLLVRGPGEGFLGVIQLRDRALSVSGSLGQWVEIGGRRYGHVLDPRTGQPLTRRRQALVVAPEATLAEALSKALLILGEREGVALVEAQPGCEGLLVDASGARWMTRGWRETVGFEAIAAPQAAAPGESPGD